MYSLTFQFERPDDEAARALLAMYDVFSQDTTFQSGSFGIAESSKEMLPFIFDTLGEFCYTGIIEDEDAMNNIIRNCREIIEQLNRVCECGHLLEHHATRWQCKVENCENCAGFQEPFEYNGELPLAE